MPLVQLKTTQAEEIMIDRLKKVFKLGGKARARVFRKALIKTYDMYKDVKP